LPAAKEYGRTAEEEENVQLPQAQNLPLVDWLLHLSR
jgi:hypothetical protein